MLDSPLPEFPEIVQFVKVGKAAEQYTAPPSPPLFVEFPVIVQSVKVGEEDQQYTPTPRLAEFPEILQPVRIGAESWWQYTPPP